MIFSEFPPEYLHRKEDTYLLLVELRIVTVNHSRKRGCKTYIRAVSSSFKPLLKNSSKIAKH